MQWLSDSRWLCGEKLYSIEKRAGTESYSASWGEKGKGARGGCPGPTYPQRAWNS